MNETERLNATFAALADPTRRAILAGLALGEASVSDLARPFAISQPAISKHLKVLEKAGLISRARDAQRRPSRLEAKPLAEAAEWLERYREFWEGTFQRLDVLLQELKGQDKRAGSSKHGIDPAGSHSIHYRTGKRSSKLSGTSALNKRKGKPI